MLDRADAIFKLALAAAAVIMAAAVGYYYGIFLPAQAASAAQQLAEAKRSEQLAAENLEEKRTADLQTARQQLGVCLASAQSDYNARWQSSCKTIHDRQLVARNNCFASGGDTSYCASYQVSDARECSLPTGTAESYDLSLQNAKQLCMGQLAVATGQTAALASQPH